MNAINIKLGACGVAATSNGKERGSDEPEKLFRNSEEAVRFALNYSMRQQGRPLADRLASPATGKSKGLSGIDGASQAGMLQRVIGGPNVDYLHRLWDWARTKFSENEIALLEGAGDSAVAMLEEARRADSILDEIDQLTVVERAAVIARFAPRSFPCTCTRACCSGYTPNPDWEKAIVELTSAALVPLSGHLSHYRVRRKLVEEFFGVKVKLEVLAEQASVNKNTVTAHRKIIKTWLGGRKAQPAKGGREAQAAEHGVESLARHKIDTLLSTLTFIGID